MLFQFKYQVQKGDPLVMQISIAPLIPIKTVVVYTAEPPRCEYMYIHSSILNSSPCRYNCKRKEGRKEKASLNKQDSQNRMGNILLQRYLWIKGIKAFFSFPQLPCPNLPLLTPTSVSSFNFERKGAGELTYACLLYLSLFFKPQKIFLPFFFYLTLLDYNFAHLEKVTDLLESNIYIFVPLPK